MTNRCTIPILRSSFAPATARGRGIGTALLTEVVDNHGVTRVDVDEQNAGARRFYLNRGFVRVGRSELDGDGRPYPIRHLEAQAEETRAEEARLS